MVTEKIFELLEERGMTANQLAVQLGIPNSIVYHWKAGRQKPSLDYVQKIADYFDVSVDYLLGRTDIPKTTNDQTFVIPPELEGVGLAFEGGAKNLTQEDLNIVAQLVKTLQNKNTASKKDD